MLVVTDTSWPFTRKGCARASTSRWAVTAIGNRVRQTKNDLPDFRETSRYLA